MLNNFIRRSVIILGVLVLLFVLAVLMFLYGNTDTEYASGYSRRGFNAIQAGMTQQEVVEILGQPLWKNAMTEDGGFWGYSMQGSDKTANYFERTIGFDSNGKVNEIIKDLYID